VGVEAGVWTVEDTLVGPDGEQASGNEALVRAACELGAGI